MAKLKKMKLTDKDILTIKYEKRTGFVFSGIIFAFGTVYNLYFRLIIENKNYLLLFLIDFFIIGFCFLIIYLMNRKLNKDLKFNDKIIKIEKVKKKEEEISYEAGSGVLNMPILGNLVPELFKKEMRAIQKWNLIINVNQFEVNKDLYDRIKENDLVELHYARYSNILLSIELIDDNK